jgi:eukaryotic-like serine/threonine-protein kinase
VTVLVSIAHSPDGPIVPKSCRTALGRGLERCERLYSAVRVNFRGRIRVMLPGTPDDEFGAYRVVRQIGSGGMACIFEATDARLGHRVAIKRLHPHIAERPGATERFLREGQAAARVRHPHVVQVFALGKEGTSAFLVMELLEGRDLGATLARHGQLTVGRALELLLPVIAAVAAAHDAGVIHRDLKPSNVFVSRGPGGREWPKVVDFGVSKVLAPDDVAALTATDGVVGTAAYMAPEQARSVREASFQSDQYSLAVILYQCVTGALPFSGSSVYELISAIMTAPVVSPSQRAEGIDAALDAIVQRAMSRHPRDRFPSVRAFGAALLPLAHPQDRTAWSAELHASAARSLSLPPEAPDDGLEGMASAERNATPPPTMPPTARDTRASGARKRIAHRILVGMTASGVIVVATAAAWLPRRQVGLSKSDSAASVPPSDSQKLSFAAPPTARAPEPPAELSRPLASISSASPAWSASTRPPLHGPAHGARVVNGPAPASAAPSGRPAPLPLGDNGAPILP